MKDYLSCRFLAAAIFSLGLWPGFLEAHSDWKVKWDQVASSAVKEGRVVIAGAAGADFRQALVSGFEKAYPGI